jgi:hypothetical protein
VPDGISTGQLVSQGPRLGSAGGAVTARIADGMLQFEAGEGRGQAHLYLIGG